MVFSQNKSSFVVDGNIQGFYITRNVEVTHGTGTLQGAEFKHYKSTLWIKTNINSAPIIEKENLYSPFTGYSNPNYPF